MSKVVKQIGLSFGKLSIYNNKACVIEIKDKDLIGLEDVEEVIKHCEENVQGEYGLISNRSSSYSINPLELYKILGESKMLKCAAVVSYRDYTERLFIVEKIIKEDATDRSFPFELFNSVKEAINWVGDLL